MSKLTGPALIVVGLLFLLFAYVSWDDAGTDFGISVHSTNPWWQFWRPNSYNVVTVPEFAITYAILGTASGHDPDDPRKPPGAHHIGRHALIAIKAS